MALDGDGPVRLAVVGASAGGVEALRGFVGALPEGLPCGVLVVQHLAPAGSAFLADDLSRATALDVETAVDGAVLRNGQVLVAPPDHHLTVSGGRVRLLQTPRENGVRPAIDPAMRSAAASYGRHAAGFVLSGARDDGAAGLLAIKRAGGRAYAQDPAEAAYAEMPRSARDVVELDGVHPVAALGALLAAAAAPVEGPTRPTTDEDALSPGTQHPAREAPGRGTRFVCPDCGGALFEEADGELPRFACSVGHAFSIASLAAGQAAAVEAALWTAVRTLEDCVEMLGRLAERARRSGHERTAAVHEGRRHEVLERALVIRELVEHLDEGVTPDGGEAA